GAIAFTRRHGALARHCQPDRCLGHGRHPATVFTDYPVRLEFEVVGLPTARPAEEQLERPVGNFEVVALVLQPLEVIKNLLNCIIAQIESQLLSLQLNRGTTRKLAYDKTRLVADRLRAHVFVRVGLSGDSTRVESGLVRERGLPDI